jgi:signal transduction histidine kinase
MSITKEIVEHHKGSISLISASGEGTQVSIYLPVHLATGKLPA